MSLTYFYSVLLQSLHARTQAQSPLTMDCERAKLSVILLLLMNALASVKTQDDNVYHVCMGNGNYPSHSAYGANLNTLLPSLPSNVTENGFYSASAGQDSDRVNALFLCRADQNLDQCRTCVQTASAELPRRCPNQKQAFIWYELCMLRYSNEPIYGIQTNDPGFRFRIGNTALSNPDKFRVDRTRLLDALRARAANGGSVLKVGAGSTNASDAGTIYGLMQCTPEISAEECNNCLIRVAQEVRSCCDSEAGVRSLRPSCDLRFQLSTFYNETRLRALQVSLSPVLAASPPPVTSPPGRNDENTRSEKKDDNTTQIVIIILVTVGVSLMVAACAVIYLRKGMKLRRQEIRAATDEVSVVDSLLYDFDQIRAATNDFADDNKLGQGGFGVVYKGKLVNGQDIAVKRLAKDSRQGNIEFKNEVVLVAKLQHKNLVRLLGFSMEGTERILIYEFIQNGSLDHIIFDPIKRSFLDWDKRYKITWGIARGLMYLHEDSRHRIIHRDLKASNVLLDGNMDPKIADFGMARLFGQDETQGNTSRIVGTYGYMPPEYAMHGRFSIKSDVFSFGVLVLEILSGRRNNYIQNEDCVENLLTSAWKNWEEGTAANILDPVVSRTGAGSLREILRCMHIGLLCVQENSAKRPTMTSIVLMLSSSTMILPVPSKPAFYMASRYPERGSKELNVKTGVSGALSPNDLSVTELCPR